MVLLPFEHYDKIVFEPGGFPKVTQITHIYNNPHWYVNHHTHTEYIEVIYIAGGQGTYTINSVPYSVKAGDLVIINSNVLHALLSSFEHPLDAWTCTISNVKLVGMDNFQLLKPDKKPVLPAGRQADFCLSVCQQIYYQRKNALEDYPIVCDHLASGLLLVVLQLTAQAEQISISEKSPAHEIMKYINEHFAEPITLKSLSDVFHMSTGRISHTVTEEFQISPINHVINCRISASLWRLINTDDSITSIAYSVGYENPYHFTKLFAKRIGLTPKAFRDAYGKENSKEPGP